MSRARLLLCLLMTALLLPGLASAGTQDEPEVEDGAGDAAASPGECEPQHVPQLCSNAYPETAKADDAEILRAWVHEPDNHTYVIAIEVDGPIDAETEMAISFVIRPTFNSTVDTTGENRTIQATGNGDGTLQSSPAAPANTTIQVDGVLFNFTFTRNDTQVAGGDILTDLTIASTGTEVRDSDPVFDRTDTTTDTAVQNASRPYSFNRPPIVPGMALDPLGGSITELPSDENGTRANTTQTRDFNGTSVATTDPNATVAFDVNLTNTGTDIDMFALQVFDPAGSLAASNITARFAVADATPGPNGTAANFTVGPNGTTANVTLAPNETAAFSVQVELDASVVGSHNIVIAANSTRGALGALALQVDLQPLAEPAPPGNGNGTPPDQNQTTDPAGRDPVLGSPQFLTDAAEALGFDKVFGDWAEVVLLALIVLLLLLIVFLVLVLATGSSVALAVEPRRIHARPGQTAEFDVEVRNRRRKFTEAQASFEGEPGWTTGLLLEGEAGEARTLRSGQDVADLRLGARKEPGSVYRGRMKVKVPETAEGGDADDITVVVAPLTESGKAKRPRKASVKVLAASETSGGSLPIRLARVEHEPEDPVAGEPLETTATLENESDEDPAHVRVVLNINGDDLQEETVEVPPGQTRAVVFDWQVPEGSVKVRVRVYPAT